MEAETQITWHQDGNLELGAAPVQEAAERGVASGYYRCDGNGGCQKVEPYFYLNHGSTVNVTCRTSGSVNLTLNFYNDSTGHGGPSLPQSGGSTNLGPGQWRIYFTGSISSYPRPSSLDVHVSYAGREEIAEAEQVEEEAVIEEERGQQFKARGKGSSRPQAIRIAYRHADEHAAGKPYRVLEERVWCEGPSWVCMLSCEVT